MRVCTIIWLVITLCAAFLVHNTEQKDLRDINKFDDKDFDLSRIRREENKEDEENGIDRQKRSGKKKKSDAGKTKKDLEKKKKYDADKKKKDLEKKKYDADKKKKDLEKKKYDADKKKKDLEKKKKYDADKKKKDLEKKKKYDADKKKKDLEKKKKYDADKKKKDLEKKKKYDADKKKKDLEKKKKKEKNPKKPKKKHHPHKDPLKCDKGNKGCCTCEGSGDPHWKGFASNKFNFQGPCTYTFAKADLERSECSFDVRVTNDAAKNKKNRFVSYVKALIISIQNRQIILRRNEAIEVDGKVAIQIPLYLNKDSIIISYQGKQSVLEVPSCGLVIRFDGKRHAQISASKVTYGERTSGLCGVCGTSKSDTVFDGNKKPIEKNKPGWELYGETFLRTGEDGLIDDQCRIPLPPPPPCSNEVEYENSISYCGLIGNTDEGAPFSECLKSMSFSEVTSTRKDCVLDVCLEEDDKGRNDAVCDALETLAENCLSTGYKVGDWRKITNCEVKCDLNEEFRKDVTCEATCEDPNALEEDCEKSPIESCTCKEGFLRYNGRCVSEDHPMCAEKQYDLCVCKSWGDPHFQTFGKKRFAFKNVGKFTMSKSTTMIAGLSCTYEVNILLEKFGNDEKALSVTKEMQFLFRKHDVRFLRNGKLLLDGKPVDTSKLPVRLGSSMVLQLLKDGYIEYLSIFVQDCVISVGYDGKTAVSIAVPRDLFGGLVSGECGQCTKPLPVVRPLVVGTTTQTTIGPDVVEESAPDSSIIKEDIEQPPELSNFENSPPAMK